MWLTSEVKYGKSVALSIAEPRVKLQVWLPDRDNDYEIGQRLRLSGRLIEPAVPLNPQAFDKRQWLHRNGVAAVLVTREYEVLDEISPRFTLQRLAYSARQWLSQRLTVGLAADGDEAKLSEP